LLARSLEWRIKVLFASPGGLDVARTNTLVIVGWANDFSEVLSPQIRKDIQKAFVEGDLVGPRCGWSDEHTFQR